MTPGWPSLIPPLIAILLAFWSKRIIVSLGAGVLAAVIVQNLAAPWLAPARALDYLAGVAANLENIQLIAFSLVVGALLKLIRDANGFAAFALAIEKARSDYGKGTAHGLTFGLSTAVFLECWSNILISGATLRPLYDRLGIARERLAYYVHTIGLNVVAMVVINGWGAFYMGVLRAQNVEQPFALIVAALPYNLYGWISLVLVAVVMITGLSIGPMRAFDRAARPIAADVSVPLETPGVEPRLSYMLVPLAVLIVTMVASLWLTGGGDITRGQGSASILYASTLAVVVLGVQLIATRAFGFVEVEEKALQGMRDFFDVSLLIVLALGLGGLCKEIGTGAYIAELARQALPAALVPAVVFVLGAVMSFATGTSYGTLAIMAPIVLPMASAAGLPPELMFAACLSGALFGDNTSPINDNSIITSMATGVPVLDHVRTQMPYALIAAGLTTVGFVGVGLALAV